MSNFEEHIEVKRVKTPGEAVEQGAMLLDKYRPGWAETVKGAMTDGYFDMTEWQTCMVGTLEMYKVDEFRARVAFNGLSFRATAWESRHVGFLPLDSSEYDRAGDEDFAFDQLDRLWRQQVLQRLPGLTLEDLDG